MPSFPKFRHAAAPVLLCFSALLSPLHSQTQFASVRGVVEDSSGATVPNAALTLTNVDQNRPWVTRTNESGAYNLPQIPPGNYRLRVEAQGFKQFAREGLILQVAQIAELNVVLELGAVTETVQVSGESPLLETASSTLGEVVNSLTSENLPLNGRNVLQLVALTPGINANTSFYNT